MWNLFNKTRRATTVSTPTMLTAKVLYHMIEGIKAGVIAKGGILQRLDFGWKGLDDCDRLEVSYEYSTKMKEDSTLSLAGLEMHAYTYHSKGSVEKAAEVYMDTRFKYYMEKGVDFQDGFIAGQRFERNDTPEVLVFEGE